MLVLRRGIVDSASAPRLTRGHVMLCLYVILRLHVMIGLHVIIESHMMTVLHVHPSGNSMHVEKLELV
jgi:hypothetical protein